MPVEHEIKLKVDSHQRLREALRSAGAELLGEWLQISHIFDSANGSLSRGDSALRVRRGQVDTLTFKGPRQAGPLKSRSELEVRVGDAETTCEILRAAGFVEVLRFETRRQSWRLRGCVVSLDELPLLGRFVEIEGPDAEAIFAVQRTLGLSGCEHLPRSYVEMLLEAAGPRDDLPVVVGFADGGG